MNRSRDPQRLVIPRPRRRPATTRAALLRRYRRPLALALLVLGIASFLSALAPGQHDERQVVVLEVARPAGAQLQAGDLGTLTLAGQVRDPGLFSEPRPLVGQRLAVGLPAGAMLSQHLLVGPQLLTGSAPGTVAVPIRLSDPATIQLLHPGQLVDIVLSSGDGFERQVSSETIGHRLAVLWVPGSARETSLGLVPAGSSPDDGIIVVAADAAQADLLSGAVTRGKVSAVLVD